MDEPSNQELLAAIRASDILAPYMESDPELSGLFRSPDHPDVHFFDRPAPARELAPVLKRRLAVMTAKDISHNLQATKRLVSFIDEHPDSQIYNVTFNCQTAHYGVRCAQLEDQVHVICVMTGGRIPDELLGESIQ